MLPLPDPTCRPDNLLMTMSRAFSAVLPSDNSHFCLRSFHHVYHFHLSLTKPSISSRLYTHLDFRDNVSEGDSYQARWHQSSHQSFYMGRFQGSTRPQAPKSKTSSCKLRASALKRPEDG